MHAYFHLKDFAFQNVQKGYAVIIDNGCDPKIVHFALSLTVSEITANLCFFKFSKI